MRLGPWRCRSSYRGGMHRARRASLSRLRKAGLGLVASSSLLLAPEAQADVGVVMVRPQAAAPGQTVDLAIGCGGCLSISVVRGHARPPSRFPVSLVPLGRAPEPRPCGPRSVCSQTRGPRQDPFIFLGAAKPNFEAEELTQAGALPRYRLRFRVPNVEPGRYAFVIFNRSNGRAEGGTSIADASRRAALLGVRRVAESESPDSGDTEATPWIAAAAGMAVAFVAGMALLARRSR